MDDSIKALLDTIYQKNDDTLMSSPCGQQLAAYIDAELDGINANLMFPDVEKCIDKDPEFNQFYTELKELLLLEKNDALIEPSTTPSFNFSFLEESNETVVDSVWEKAVQAGQNIEKLISAIDILIQNQVASFSELPSSLSIENLSLQPLRDGNDEFNLLQMVEIPTVDGETKIKLQIGPTQNSKIILRLIFEDKDNNEPVQRVRTSLRDVDNQLLQSVQSNSQGIVDFSDVMPNQYILDIKIQEQRFHVPINILLE